MHHRHVWRDAKERFPPSLLPHRRARVALDLEGAGGAAGNSAFRNTQVTESGAT